MPAEDLTVTGSSDPFDEPDTVTFGGIPPVFGRVAAVAGVLALLIGLGAVASRRPAATGYARPGPPVAAPPPIAPETALPADIVFAAPAGSPTVLVDRNGVATPLPVAVVAAVKVPSGWVVDAGERALHLRGTSVTDLGGGDVFVDGTGTRVALFRGTTVSVVSLPGAAVSASTGLPASVRVVGWLGADVLVDAGAGRLDRWTPGEPYAETPGFFAGNYLGSAGDALVMHRRDGTLDCIVLVPDLRRPGQEYRCGFGVPVDGAALEDGGWPAVAPGGAYAAMPGADRSPYFAPLPAMLDGGAGFARAQGLPAPVRDLTWRDGVTAAVLVEGDDANVWTCAAATRTCQAKPVTRPGLIPTRLATRLPAGH